MNNARAMRTLLMKAVRYAAGVVGFSGRPTPTIVRGLIPGVSGGPVHVCMDLSSMIKRSNASPSRHIWNLAFPCGDVPGAGGRVPDGLQMESARKDSTRVLGRRDRRRETEAGGCIGSPAEPAEQAARYREPGAGSLMTSPISLSLKRGTRTPCQSLGESRFLLPPAVARFLIDSFQPTPGPALAQRVLSVTRPRVGDTPQAGFKGCSAHDADVRTVADIHCGEGTTAPGTRNISAYSN